MKIISQILHNSDIINWCSFVFRKCVRIFGEQEQSVSYESIVAAEIELESREKKKFMVARCIFKRSQKTFFISMDVKNHILWLFQSNESSFAEQLYIQVKLKAYVPMPL